MYKVTVLETAKELLDTFSMKDSGDKLIMPAEAYVVFEGDHDVHLSGVKNLPFGVSEKVRQNDVIEELFSRVGVKIYIT